MIVIDYGALNLKNITQLLPIIYVYLSGLYSHLFGLSTCTYIIIFGSGGAKHFMSNNNTVDTEVEFEYTTTTNATTAAATSSYFIQH